MNVCTGLAEWCWQETAKYSEILPVAGPFYPTQFPHWLVWSWTLASTFKCRRLTTWAIARGRLSVMRNIWRIFTLTEERTRSSDHSKSRTYVRQVFVNTLTSIRGTLTVSYRTLQYSQPVRTECKAESNSSETIAIRVPACIGNKNMNFTVKGNPSWNIYLTQTVKKRWNFDSRM